MKVLRKLLFILPLAVVALVIGFWLYLFPLDGLATIINNEIADRIPEGSQLSVQISSWWTRSSGLAAA